MQVATAGLIFIIYSKSGKRQINNFKDKVEVIRRRCPHLSSIQVVADEDFKQGKGFEIRARLARRTASTRSYRKG